jgi:hypothetical protein
MITVKCSCGKIYQVKDSYANKKAKCTCGRVLSVPEFSVEELDRPTEKISFSCCNCGKTFNVSSKFQGKKVRCKSCHTVQTIPMKSEEPDKNEDKELDDDSDAQTDDFSAEKQVSDPDDNDSDTQDASSEEQVPETTKSSEKPKRLLLICLVMVLLGALAYGLIMFYSENEVQQIPVQQSMPSDTLSEEKPESTPESIAQEDIETDVKADETPADTTSEETQPEKKEEPIVAPVTSDTQADVLQKKTERIIDKQPAPQKIETETTPEKEAPADSTQTKTQADTQNEIDTQKMIASVDPKTLKEDTKKYLRATPMTYTKKQVIDMIQKYNFYEAHFNPNGGFPNRFVDNRNGTITDNETFLMWQKSGTREMVSWKKAPEYIDRLNNRKFAGYSGWRLPTLEELLTLTEPRHSRQGLYISNFFSQKQGIVGSSDTCTYDGKNLPWYVSFLRGISNCISYNLIDEFHVRAVRSMDRPDKQIHN